MVSQLPPGYKKGTQRLYVPSTPSPTALKSTYFTKIDRLMSFILLSMGILIRLYKLPSPSSVVFDETHFGGFARNYYHGEFFVDVHPPLTKLLFFIISSLGGWNGEFQFAEIGDEFDGNVPYIAMRLSSGIFGVLTVLLTYSILKSSGCRPIVSFMGAAVFCIENSFVTISRLIMLDSSLIFTIALTIFAVKKLQLTTPFTKEFYRYLILTGFGIGLAISVKWVGFFTMSWVGILTLVQLWNVLGDIEVSDRQWFKHVFVRAVFLIILPAIFYLGFFAIHFILLPHSGEGSGYMTPDFRATFADSTLLNTPSEVFLGSTITIKHVELGAYLHSHNLTYPGGSQEQQVTMYGFDPDDNNEWIIESKHKTLEGHLQTRRQSVSDGDIVRFYHKSTGKYLHVNDVRPPISEKDYNNEVSCDGDRELLADINYNFKIKIAREYTEPGVAQIKLRAARSIFQIFHQGTRCTLLSHDVKLPVWASSQQEVICSNEPTIPNTLWYIESNSHPLLDDDFSHPRVTYKRYTFWHKFWELQKTMWRINKSLTEDHTYSSTPDSWPFVLRGINFYGSNNINIYYLGNISVYWSTFFFVSLFIAKNNFQMIKRLNPYKLYTIAVPDVKYYQAGLEFMLGWAIHYAPSFFMGRQLFSHHYLGSLYFGILLLSQTVEYFISKNKIIGYLLLTLILTTSVACYYQFIPLIYGLDWNVRECNNAKWLNSWDINCFNYKQ